MQYGIGVRILCEIVDANGVPIDLSLCTVKRIYVEKPSARAAQEKDADGELILSGVVYWDAEFVTDGTDGKIQFITTSITDLDEVGRYSIQAYCKSATEELTSSVSRFQVRRGIFDTAAVSITAPVTEVSEMSLIKQCVADITSSNLAPILLEPYNDIPGTITATRTGAGVTTLTHSNHGFPVGGRTIIIPIGWANILSITNPTDETIVITTADDGDLVSRQFVITVYPQT
jgi:hypothetical protein